MTHKKFKKFWNVLRLWLVVRELKKLSRSRPTIPIAYALVLVLSACAPSRAPSLPTPKQDPVVVILHDGVPACSGVAIAPHEILTAAHCVRDKTVEFVTAEDWNATANASSLAQTDYVDLGRDLAALHSEYRFISPIKFREPVELEPVHARSIYFGATSSGYVLRGAGFFRDTTMGIALGWSGSPVFGADGRVVGIVHSCLADRGKCLPDNAQISVLP